MNLIFSNYDSIDNPFYGGGGAVAIHEVAKRLAGEFNVKVITGKYPGSKDEVVDGVSYKRIGFSKLPPQISQLVFQVFLPFVLIKENFDIWIESFTPPFSTAFLPLFTKKPVIGLAHLLGGDDMSKKYKLPFNVLEKFGLKFYKHCITPTEAVKKRLISKNTNLKVSVISNGVSRFFLEQDLGSRDGYILYLGRLDINQKGLDVLLDAYSKVANRVSLPMVIAGSGVPKDENFLKNRIKALGLQEKVFLKGKVKDDAKIDLYKKGAFLVMPSRFETFGMVALEAMAFGLPVVTSNLQELNWIPDIAGDKFKTGNSDELANAILHLASNTEQRKIMGNAGRDYASRLTWKNVSENYSNVIKSLV